MVRKKLKNKDSKYKIGLKLSIANDMKGACQ